MTIYSSQTAPENVDSKINTAQTSPPRSTTGIITSTFYIRPPIVAFTGQYPEIAEVAHANIMICYK